MARGGIRTGAGRPSTLSYEEKLKLALWCQNELETRARKVALEHIVAQPLIQQATAALEQAQRLYGKNASKVGEAVQTVFGQRKRGRTHPVRLRYGSRKKVIEDAAKRFKLTERMVRSVWSDLEEELAIILSTPLPPLPPIV